MADGTVIEDRRDFNLLTVQERLSHQAEEPVVGDAVRSYPDTQRVMIDAGANLGVYTFLAAQRFSHVYAIEPHPFNVQFLRHVGMPNVTVVGCALGRTEDHQRLWLSTHTMGHTTNRMGNGNNSDDSMMVPGVTFDSLWAAIKEQGQTVGLIKCDIEGAEDWAWKSARTLLQENRPWLLIVLETHLGVDLEGLRSFFNDNGYSWAAKDGKPPTEIVPTQHYLIKSHDREMRELQTLAGC